jgi:D-alanyl-D-alanine carboxypeptidase/D-alanyl-D-alanine-endopeptidase (penicillin-binding protein 4)
MRSPVAKILALLVTLGTSSGAAANATDASASIDPTRRTRPPRLTPPAPQRSAEPSASDRATDWPGRIDARLGALAQQPPTVGEAPLQDPELARALMEIAASAGPRATVGIAVRDLATGGMLAELDADTLLNPASNLKLLTAAAAVELLGADFRYETRIARAGADLILIGSGDPSLQIEDLRNMVESLQPRDLEGVRRIVVDDSAFSDRRFGPGYDSDGPGFSYQAPSGALSLQFNTVEVTVRPAGRAQAASVSLKPACDHLVVASSATTGRGRPLSVTTQLAGDQTRVSVHGTVRPGGGPVRIRRRIEDPGLFAGTTFARLLARHHGGEPLNVVRGTGPRDASVVHVHRSAPLVEVLGSALKFSNNFTTEQLLRTLGHLATGEPGDWHNGREIVRRFWDALGLVEDDLVFVNASGLGRAGRITPRALVTLLGLVANPQRRAASMVDAMPIAGREGTLVGRLRRTHGRVRAKTGTLTGASGLTGVISDADGSPRVAFSILVNGRIGTSRARRIQDRVVRTLVDRG